MSFLLTSNWLDRENKPSKDELDATLGAIRMIVGKINITEHVELTDDLNARVSGQSAEKLHIPTYFISEWIAENWWALLYEPKKTEDEHNIEYDTRHSILSAKHGFALPDLNIQPSGSSVVLSCRASDDLLAGVRFKNSSTAVLSRRAVQAVLSGFVASCVARLESKAILDTPMQRAWEAVVGTAVEQSTFCELAGALGLDPYSVADDTFRAIEATYDALGHTAALDLCMASSELGLLNSSNIISATAKKLNGPHQINLTSLKNVRPAQDNMMHPGYRRGRTTAIRVREYLTINAKDKSGSDKFFDALNLDCATAVLQQGGDAIFSAAVDRQELDASMVLTPPQEEARRFAACRGVFLALDSGEQSRRICTDTVTRDQQASRAFAAEILVPFDYLKMKAVNGRLSRDSVTEIAHELRAGADAVRWQAMNNGLVVDQPGSDRGMRH